MTTKIFLLPEKHMALRNQYLAFKYNLEILGIIIKLENDLAEVFVMFLLD
jgi:hypothetical protein